jgi:hypothetical protein
MPRIIFESFREVPFSVDCSQEQAQLIFDYIFTLMED